MSWKSEKGCTTNNYIQGLVLWTNKIDKSLIVYFLRAKTQIDKRHEEIVQEKRS